MFVLKICKAHFSGAKIKGRHGEYYSQGDNKNIMCHGKVILSRRDMREERNREQVAEVLTLDGREF